MKTIKYHNAKASLRKAMKVLYRELGPVEMLRVTALGHGKQEDSVKLHWKIQNSFDDEACVKEVLEAYRKS
jgi:hypothetical protein